MSNYYFRRATNLETSQLIDIIMDIDNGYYEVELDKKDPSEMGFKEFTELIQKTKKLTQSNLIKIKINSK